MNAGLEVRAGRDSRASNTWKELGYENRADL